MTNSGPGRFAGISTLAVLICAGLLSGCGDDDPPTAPGTPFQAPPATTPQNALHALTLYYQNRDTVGIASVYDSAYAGTSTDFAEPPGSQTIHFTYADEIAHVAALRKSVTISDVRCDFGPSSIWVRQSSDDLAHPDWAVIQLNSFIVEITAGVTSYTASSGGGDPMTFRFNPRPDSTSSTDTTWTIIGWEEIRN